MKKLSILFSILLISLASAQIGTQSIIVSPVSNFTVDVTVDRDSTGNQTPNYAIGETIRISVRPNQAAYIYLYDVNAQGHITQLLPNRLSGGQNNYVQAGETRTFPASGSRFQYTVNGPQGIDRVVAVASRTPLNTEQLAQFSQGNFAQSSLSVEAFARTLSIIVNPLPQGDWVSDTTQFLVQARTPAPIASRPVITQPLRPVTPPQPVYPVTPVQPAPDYYTLSSCAALDVPAVAVVESLQDNRYSSTATLRTAYELYDIYEDLAFQLEQQGFYEAFLDNDIFDTYLDAIFAAGTEQINLNLESDYLNDRVYVSISCTY